MPVLTTAIAAAALAEIGIEATTAVIVAGVTLGTAAEVLGSVLSIGLSFGIGALAQAIAGTPKQPKPHASRENFRNPVAPRVRYYGRVKIGGPYAFLKTGPMQFTDFDTPTALYQIVALAQGEFDFIEEYWLADEHVELEHDGAPSWPNGWVKVPTHYYQDGGDHKYVYMRSHTGTRFQGADSFMTLNWGGQWTSAFTGLEIPYVIVASISPAAVNFSKVFPAGLSTVSAVCRTSKVWDPRDLDQDPNRPSTWAYSSNGVLCVLDAVWNKDGLRLPLEMILPAIEAWKAEATFAGGRRRLKNGGSECHWYRLSGGYKLTDPPKDWLPKMLDPMDARLALRGDGAIVIDCGRWRVPSLTISDDEIVGYSNLSRGKTKPDIRNRIDATFISEDYGYQQQQADPILNESSIDVDGEQSAALDLDWCPSHAQARCRMKIEAERQDPHGWCGSIFTKAYGLKFLTPNGDGSRRRFVRFQIAELAIDDTFEVTAFSFDWRTGRCTFTVNAMSAAAYGWNPVVDEGTAPGLARNTSANGVEIPYNLQISISGSSIAATIDAPLQTALVTVLDWRVSNERIGDDQASWHWFNGATGNLANGHYDVRARFHDNKSPVNYSDPVRIRGIPVWVSGDIFSPGALATESGEVMGTERGCPLGVEV